MLLTISQKKAIDQYYKELSAYQTHNVSHETAVRSAFQNLLAVFAQSANWTLIPEQTLANGKRPDGTLRDSFNLPRGYWEAKDTRDDLIIEIHKKINAGYPITNTIFEDTRRAILYQNNKQVLEVDLKQPKELTNVLDCFFHYAEPDIATFEHAVEDFKDSIPDLAQGLLKIIKEEHAKNKSFASAFSSFLNLCRTSLDLNMSSETVDEMLVQHLLTERLFRTVFDNQDFTNRNVIASEIEKVIQALTSRAFNRKEFLKSLDRFYIAIENAARNLDDWSEKQHFLNTVYERFFKGFSIKQADTHGIVYTPQEIVDFMCASVDLILKRDFGSSLSTPGVQILDPCVGTGNFIVNLIQRINGNSLAYKYEHDLFCNELMLLPYYIASLNIEHAYYERTGEYKPFEGIAFADTLDLAEGRQLPLFVEKNTERVENEKQAQIMVVIGNPPYNVGQKSDDDNNKNRSYKVIDQRIRETYVKDSTGRLHNKPYDPYVRFFRWAVDRLGTRDGIVCLVTNNSFIEQAGFEGIRKHFLQDFTKFYHLDLHGNVRKNPTLSGTVHNVFGIKLGVGITIAIRLSQTHSTPKLYYHRTPEDWIKKEKLSYLSEKKNLTGIEWQELQPDERHTWLTEKLQPEFATFLPLGLKEMQQAKSHIKTQTLFSAYSLGVSTNRDDFAYDFNRNLLLTKMSSLIDFYNNEVDRWKRRGDSKITIDNFVTYNDKLIKWSGDLKIQLTRGKYASYSTKCIKRSLYRPFAKRYLYFDPLLNNSIYLQHLLFPCVNDTEENIVICLTGLGAEKPFMVLATNMTPDMHLVGAGANTQCFPLYIYNLEGTTRKEAITDWALAEFQNKYGIGVSKLDIFHYLYAMLHQPQYREQYAENLKHDLPRIPLLTSQSAFETCVLVGKRLMELHLHYDEAQEYPLNWLENKDVPINWRVEKMKLSPDKASLRVNEWLTLGDIPQVCYQYRLGNRSALEWVIDQYQVSTDARSGIISDPNNEDNPEYIVRLVGRVVTVSIETVRLVEELAREVTQEEWLSEDEQHSIQALMESGSNNSQ